MMKGNYSRARGSCALGLQQILTERYVGPQSQKIMAQGKVGHRRQSQNKEGDGDTEYVPLQIRDGTSEGAYVRQ